MGRFCTLCGIQITTKNKSGLCIKCKYNHDSNHKIKSWKETGETGCKVATTLRNCIRGYILNKQNNKCAICGCGDIWYRKPLNFILDHIDGDASNNWEDNLRLVCPNCDSQLDTFKSRNRNSARTHRKCKPTK